MLQRAYYLFRSVAERYEVALVAFNQKALLRTRESLQEAKTELGKLSRTIEIFDIPCDERAWGRHCLAAKSYLLREAFTISWLRSREYQEAVVDAARRLKPDIVHFDTISLAPYAERLDSCRKVLNHHNIESMMMARRAALERNPLLAHYFSVEAQLIRRWEQEAASSFDLHLVCSKLDGARLRSIAPKAFTEIVPNGVDIEHFQPGISREEVEENSLIFVGGLGWYPNRSAVEFLTRRVWPLLIASRPSVVLTIVGKDPPGWLRELAERDNRIRVTGFVDDVRPYIDRAAVYVCPIFDGGGTKLKVLDAMGMGKALVAHPIAMEGIDAIEGQHWCAAETPEEFAKVVIKLLENKELRRTMGRRARQFVCEHYSFFDIGRRYADRLYEIGGGLCASSSSAQLMVASQE